jgi:hypothetical protein
MNRFAQSIDNPQASAKDSATPDDDLASLYHYPSLGRLFEQPRSAALSEMRARLDRTSQDLARVVRQGSREDADRAARAARAIETTLSLLDDLEKLQGQSDRAT